VESRCRCFVAGLILWAACATKAQTFDSHGFEAPYFTPGSITGQDGWDASADAADIVAGAGVGGTQGLVITHGAYPTHSLNQPVPGDFVLDFDLKLGSGWRDNVQPGGEVWSGVELRWFTNQFHFIDFMAEYDDGRFQGYSVTYDFGSYIRSPQILDLTTYHHLTLWYVAFAGEVRGIVDNQLVSVYDIPANQRPTSFGDVSLFNALYLADGGTATFDNFSIAPEPASGGGLGIAVLLLMRRRVRG
jgi:hypothetical protein